MNRTGKNSVPSLAAVRGVSRVALVLSALFSLAVNLLMLTVPIYMMQVFDRVLSSRSTETLIMLSVIAIVALLALGALDAARSIVLGRLGAWVERKLGGQVIGAAVLAGHGTGSPSAQGLRDLATVRGFLSGPGPVPLLDVPWTPLFLFAVFMLHPILGGVATTGAIVLAVIAIGHELLARRTLRGTSTASIRTTQQAEAAVHNAGVIQAMGMLPALVLRWQEQGLAPHTQQLRASRHSAAVSGAAKFLRLTLQMAILGVGAWLVLRGELTGGAMIAASILMGRALAPIEMAISGWRSAVMARAAYKRVCAALSAVPDRPDGIALPPPAGRIGVDNVTFAYPTQADPILRAVRFALEPGELLVIVGAAGAGKTTLARLLVGIHAPRFGSVRLDGADIRHWPHNQRRRHIGYLPQDVELFAGTVRENIARMQDTDDGVVAAAQLVGAHEMILSLPQGYATEIGVGGTALSGGQRQWIALARAVHGYPRFVVLDEPNASLDRQGETALLKALDKLRRQGTTVIVIAHRPNVLQSADKILFLQDGQVQMFGPREAVLPRLIKPAAAAS